MPKEFSSYEIHDSANNLLYAGKNSSSSSSKISYPECYSNGIQRELTIALKDCHLADRLFEYLQKEFVEDIRNQMLKQLGISA
jgi:hypothetical protein